ncbi:MAG: hypothetical protein AAGA48_19655 [Myxococcota bacterium]
MLAWWFAMGCVLSIDGWTRFGQPVERVVIDVDTANVTLRGRPGPVDVDVDVGGWGDGDVELVVDDGVLFIDYACEQQEWCGGDLTVEMPSDTPTLTSLQNGDIFISDLNDDAVVNLLAGRLTVREHGRGPVVVASNGGVDLSFSETPDRVDVETGAGDVRLLLPAGGYAFDVEAATVRFDKTILDDPTSPHTIRVRTPGTARFTAVSPPVR